MYVDKITSPLHCFMYTHTHAHTWIYVELGESENHSYCFLTRNTAHCTQMKVIKNAHHVLFFNKYCFIWEKCAFHILILIPVSLTPLELKI